MVRGFITPPVALGERISLSVLKKDMSLAETAVASSPFPRNLYFIVSTRFASESQAMIFFTPFTLRMSRLIYINIFVHYDATYKNEAALHKKSSKSLQRDN